MKSTNNSMALRAIGCHRCDAEAGVRLGREFLCGSCAVQDLGSELEPPVVLCDVCQRESTLRLKERFLCGRCALALLCLDAETEPDVARGFEAALSSAVVGQREPATDSAWEIARRTREGALPVGEASAMYHRALAAGIGAADGSERTGRWLRAGSAVFGTCAAAVDGRVRALVDEIGSLRTETTLLEELTYDLRRERDELRIRVRRSEAERGALIRHLTSAKEEERGRIAEEIHDDTVQTLVAVQMRLQALGGRSAEGGGTALGELVRATAASIGRLRTLMFELRSDLLERYGLVGTLRELLRRTEEQFGIATRLDDRLGFEPESDVRANVYRIAQEAITNARKHARGSNIDLRLEGCGGGVALTVTDDGSGFDVEVASSDEHAGLRFMRERAERAGGWMHITTSPGVGTEVACWIPNPIGGDR
jgi:signal transduction histidine kinase